jgi:hypothetical protein
MMHVEAWSKDVSVHGDGESTTATINLAWEPFNLDFSKCGPLEVSAEGLISAGPPEELMDLQCEMLGTSIVITFPEPVQDRESMVVRVRMKMFV